MRKPAKPTILTAMQVGLDKTGITTLNIEFDPDGKTNDPLNPDNGQKGNIWISINGKEIYSGPTIATDQAALKIFVQGIISEWQKRQSFDNFITSLV